MMIAERDSSFAALRTKYPVALPVPMPTVAIMITAVATMITSMVTAGAAAVDC